MNKKERKLKIKEFKQKRADEFKARNTPTPRKSVISVKSALDTYTSKIKELNYHPVVFDSRPATISANFIYGDTTSINKTYESRFHYNPITLDSISEVETDLVTYDEYTDELVDHEIEDDEEYYENPF